MCWRWRGTDRGELGVEVGQGRRQLLANLFSAALRIVGSGVVVGNLLLILLVMTGQDRIPVAFVIRALAITSTVMLVVGLLACIVPAKRALRIHPTEALRQT